jgi:hypothetical protein
VLCFSAQLCATIRPASESVKFVAYKLGRSCAVSRRRHVPGRVPIAAGRWDSGLSKAKPTRLEITTSKPLRRWSVTAVDRGADIVDIEIAFEP